MIKKTNLLWISLMGLSLSACTTNENAGYMNYYTTYDNSPFYTARFEESNYYNYQPAYKKSVSVPESYHVGAFHSPVSHQDRDKQWVSTQNPEGYTIEVADDEKPASVAGALYKAPKNERMAELKYYRNGKPYYKGVYGSYDNYEAAQKAYNALPEAVKSNAGIKNWGKVQSNISP